MRQTDKHETLAENRARLHAWLRRDLRFARVTVAREGANLVVWWPPLSAEERTAAVDTARLHVAQWEGRHPDEAAAPVAMPEPEPTPFRAFAEEPVSEQVTSLTAGPPPAGGEVTETEPPPVEAVDSGVRRRLLAVAWVLAAVAGAVAIGCIAYALGVPAGDLGVIAILGLSALFAAIRGLVRELLSLVGWVGAGVAAWLAFPYAQPLFEKWLGYRPAANVLAPLAVFCVTLTVWLWLSDQVERWLHRSLFNAGDRLLGLLFGLARGALLIGVIYLVLGWFRPPDQLPGIAEAWARPYAALSADYVRLGGEWLYRRLMPYLPSVVKIAEKSSS